MKKITDKEIQEFRDFAKDHTIPEIAKHFNRSETNIRHRVYKWKVEYKMNYKRLDKKEVDRFAELAETKTVSELAEIFNISQPAICKRLKKLNNTNKDTIAMAEDTITKAVKKVQKLGYKHTADYIAQNGVLQFKRQIMKI